MLGRNSSAMYRVIYNTMMWYDIFMRRLTPKEQEYAKAVASGMTRRDAVRTAYDVKKDVAKSTLDNMAGRIEKRPAVMSVLENAQEEAQRSIVDVMTYSTELGRSGSREGASYAQVALVGANSVLDRIYGKAKQSIDITSKSVNINIDLSNEDM